MDGFSFSSIQALSNLLSASSENQEDEDEVPNSATPNLGPGHIGPAKRSENTDAVALRKKNSKDIWDEGEVPEGSEYDDTFDSRQQPEYEVIFKQHVGTEDVFLGMSRKDPSSACCECMLIKVKLPETKLADVHLDVKQKFLDLRSPKYKLGLHLPHPVDSENGKARFITEAQTLEVTLTMKRDFDFINF
ncbi:protein PIH1D3 [Polypterus senegalus]|uniref:protein PIH1D3 n=1 Tax=Polypterus senegalus TaxID=55291 RepID=UPI0019654A3F|nr:protein PIH1D3 [Polypterus senegalus]